MIALDVGLKREPAPAAIVGYSGALATAEALPKDPGSAPAILLVHGDMDQVIPVDAMFMAREQLARAGLAVEWHLAQGIGHGVDPEGLRLGGAFLRQAFALDHRPHGPVDQQNALLQLLGKGSVLVIHACDLCRLSANRPTRARALHPRLSRT